jgi:GPI mannosyltransferase 3
MFAEIKKIIQQDRKLQLILLGGLIIQVITSITAIGFSNFDQHFSVVEFSSWQLGNENAASYAFELEAKIRPTLQVYLFTGYYKACMFLHIEDPYQQLTILRIILGLVMFLVFNLIAFYYFKNGNRKILYYVLLILNFSWIFPYTRTLYSSEMLSGLFLFGSIFLYDAKRDKKPSFLFITMIGFLFSLAFYFRFQTGLALAGFGLWMVLFEKKYARLLPLATGFLIGLAINIYLDYKFYHEFVISPYRYFQWNIIEGKSAEFGTSSFLKYIGLLIAVIIAPPFSLILFYQGIKTYFKKYNHPVFIPVLLFIIGHCLIGHKEERFLYPIFSALPIIVGYGLPDLINYYKTCKRWIASFIKVMLIITIVINTILLILFTSIPYSQTIYFSKVLKNRFEDKPTTIYCLYRTPFETMSGVPMVFYRKGAKNLDLKYISNIDTVRSLTGNEIFVATTFNESKFRRGLFDSLGYKPVMYSSKLLWNINGFLQSKKIKNTINDVWVLYRKE